MENSFTGQALGVNVIVKEKIVENKTASGIDMTGYVSANEKQKRGIVVSIGEGCPRKGDGTQTINIGDEICFDKTRETAFTDKGVQYLIIYYQEIVLKF